MNQSPCQVTGGILLNPIPHTITCTPGTYVNLKAGLTFTDVEKKLLQDTGANAYAKLNFLIAELKNKQLAADKS